MKTIVNAATNQGLDAVDGAVVRLVRPLPPSEPALCAPLEALVSQLELEHPHFPVPYGTADLTFTGGPGVDWKPFPRASPSSVEGLPTTALLSQALVAFAIEYEKQRHGSIQWAATSCAAWAMVLWTSRLCRSVERTACTTSNGWGW